jgi:hypothetical protein
MMIRGPIAPSTRGNPLDDLPLPDTAELKAAASSDALAYRFAGSFDNARRKTRSTALGTGG